MRIALSRGSIFRFASKLGVGIGRGRVIKTWLPNAHDAAVNRNFMIDEQCDRRNVAVIPNGFTSSWMNNRLFCAGGVRSH